MDIYFYCEQKGCINSGKPVLLGNSDEYLGAILGGAVAICGTKEGDFSGSAGTVPAGCRSVSIVVTASSAAYDSSA